MSVSVGAGLNEKMRIKRIKKWRIRTKGYGRREKKKGGCVVNLQLLPIRRVHQQLGVAQLDYLAALAADLQKKEDGVNKNETEKISE